MIITYVDFVNALDFPRFSLSLRAPQKRALSQWEIDPPGRGSLKPVAIGAVVEVTKRPKPSKQGVTQG